MASPNSGLRSGNTKFSSACRQLRPADGYSWASGYSAAASPGWERPKRTPRQRSGWSLARHRVSLQRSRRRLRSPW